jgi:hypothetical protein
MKENGSKYGYMRSYPRLLLSVGTLLALGLGLAWNATATSSWEARDLRPALTSSARQPISLLASRADDWLMSDGSALWSVNAQGETTAYTDKLGGSRVVSITAHGSWYTLALENGSGTRFLKTNLREWTELASQLPRQEQVTDLQTDGLRWVALTKTQGSAGLPATWNAFLLEENGPAQALSLPSEVSRFVGGCVKEVSQATICASQPRLLPLQGTWYLFAGSAETRTAQSTLLQEGVARVWKRGSNGIFEVVSQAPKARFMSGAWHGTDTLLVATGNAPSNPFAPDTFWRFDGRVFTPYRQEPLAAGMLSVDTRSTHVGSTPKGYVITAGKTLVRWESGSFRVEGLLRDRPMGVASLASGKTLVVGQASAFGETSPVYQAPSVILLGSDVSDWETNTLLQPRERIASRQALTRFSGSPETPTITIQQGDAYTYTARATDLDGIRRIEIFAHGTRVKTCEEATCSFTQTFWTNGAQERTVLFSAQATDLLGNTQSSDVTRLIVQDALVTTGTPINVNGDLLLPPGLTWNRDQGTGMNWASWTSSADKNLATINDTRALAVATHHADGIERIEYWVNGKVAKTCEQQHSGEFSLCSYTLAGKDVSYGGETFINARILSTNGKEAWTEGERFTRK